MYKIHSFAVTCLPDRACIYAYLMHCSCVLKRADKNNFSQKFSTRRNIGKKSRPNPTRGQLWCKPV